MRIKSILLIYILFSLSTCKVSNRISDYQSKNISIQTITKNTFIHTSYLKTKSFGEVPCNGMIVINKGEAIIFDTPTNDSVSLELINLVEQQLECKVKGIIVTHFHVDCLGGLQEFHKRDIPSYASNLTIELTKSKNETIPKHGFNKYLELTIGGKKVICEYFGEGHTKDNIIGFYPSEKVLFGGCLIKSKGAGKGNLNDANIEDWSKTVTKIKAKYKNLDFVIPGHGKSGGTELLDYTIKLFEKK